MFLGNDCLALPFPLNCKFKTSELKAAVFV